jgi:NAD(P)-dependent dehydrogenase (short-subunit alcohol dehydrogenase family)
MEEKEQTRVSGERSFSRRSFLGTTAIAVAAGTAAFAAGVSVGHASVPTAAPKIVAGSRFKNKVVLITGATSGIGRAAALAFAAEGGKVAFCGRRENLGGQVEQEIRNSGGEATYIKADVRKEQEVKAFVDQAVQKYGGLHVAFNNAGITLQKPLHEYTSEEWDDVINTNLRGVFLSMKYQIPHFLAAGGGNILITSSSNAIATEAERSPYSASKRGLVGLVQSAALDYAQKGIRINAIVPGTTNTALIRKVAGMENVPDAAWDAMIAQWAKTHVPGLGRVATPEEIANFVLMLAADDHPYMTGASLVIDGGKTAHA